MPKTLFVRFLMIGLIGASLGACVAPRGYYSGTYVYSSGPPAETGYFNYWYYPGARVYYDIQRHVYFYPRNGGWVRVRQLPPPMKARLGHHVIVHSRHERPYVDHDNHRREYPAGRYEVPQKKAPEQYRYQPHDNRRDSRRDERQDRRQDDRYYRNGKDEKRKDKRSSDGKERSKHYDKSDKYDKDRNDNKSRRYDRYNQDQQNQEPPRKY